jgi:hypothetical protein
MPTHAEKPDGTSAERPIPSNGFYNTSVESGTMNVRQGAVAHARLHATRVLHVLLPLIVLRQPISGNLGEAPLPGGDAEWPHMVHEWVALVGFELVPLIWIWTSLRNPSETRLSRLVPSLSASERAGGFRDARVSLRDLTALKAPADSRDSLASEVHGLGLRIVCIMATSGASWFLFFAVTPIGTFVMFTHNSRLI